MVVWLLDAALAVLVAAVLMVAVLAGRRRWMQRSGGTFDCSLRERPRSHGKGWVLGVARYVEDTVEWYRVFSLSPWPRRTFSRRGFQVLDRRKPAGPETYALMGGATIVRCRDHHSTLELALTEDALTGLLSWLEAAPPGQRFAVDG